jgi:hypothetical protein
VRSARPGAKNVVRSIYDHHDPDLTHEFVERLGRDLQDKSCPIEVRSLGRTLIRWKDQIAAWHRGHITNGPTEAANNLIKRIKRVAFGFTRFRNYRIRVLLYAGNPTGTYSPPSHPAEIRRAVLTLPALSFLISRNSRRAAGVVPHMRSRVALVAGTAR